MIAAITGPRPQGRLAPWQVSGEMIGRGRRTIPGSNSLFLAKPGMNRKTKKLAAQHITAPGASSSVIMFYSGLLQQDAVLPRWYSWNLVANFKPLRKLTLNSDF